jgi:hypothetical protein
MEAVMGTQKKPAIRPSQILEHLDVDDLQELAGRLLEDGLSEKEVVDELAALVDRVVQLDVLLGGTPAGAVAGAVLEAVDRDVIIRPIVRQIVRAVANPEQRRKVLAFLRGKKR